MGQWQNTRTKDVVVVPEALDGKYEANPEWEKAKAPEALDGKYEANPDWEKAKALAKKSTSNTGSN